MIHHLGLEPDFIGLYFCFELNHFNFGLFSYKLDIGFLYETCMFLRLPDVLLLTEGKLFRGKNIF